MRVAAFTIVAKNYLPFARVLMESLQKWAPGIERFAILVDRPQDYFDPSKENFEIVPSEDLNIPRSAWFHFKYSILELSTAVKPYAFEYLFERFGFERVIYFDPDIQILNSLDALLSKLEECSILLTPHLTAPLNDTRRPTDLDILRSGTYNLGFIAVQKCAESDQFLQWWQTKLYEQCVVDLPRGLFVDQRWIDLVPGMFQGVEILRDPGYNVAYWNLAQRRVTRHGRFYQSNGSPLYFFHFSGLDPENAFRFSRHQNRFTLDDLGEARQLVLDYRDRLLSQGYSSCKAWPYVFGTFENGFPIPDLGRPAHHEVPETIYKIENPFSDEGFRAFVELWNQPVQGPAGKPTGITRLAYRIYKTRADLHAVMPDVLGGDLVPFLRWLVSTGKAEHNIEDVFLAPIWESLERRKEQSDTFSQSAINENFVNALSASGVWVDPRSDLKLAALNELINTSQARLHLSRLAQAIYESRSDLQRFFPDPYGRDSVRFLLWFLTYGAAEYALAAPLVAPLREQWETVLSSLPTPFHRLWFRGVLFAMGRSIEWRKFTQNRISWIARGRAAFHARRSDRQVPAGGFIADNASSSADREGGINLIGYFRSEMGVGESVRCAASAARAVHLQVALKNVTDGVNRANDDSFAFESRRFPYPVNLFHVNADQALSVVANIGPEFLERKYNIGYWAWELEEFPTRWLSSFAPFQEIWAPSTFCQEAIGRKAPIPVVRMPHAIKVERKARLDRAAFSIPEDRFVFLTAFDFMSVPERKNPLAAIRAFREAFESSPSCHLVLKMNNVPKPGHSLRDEIVRACSDLPVTIIDRTIDRDHVNCLVNVCDCFVSLHRSEGFGLMLAEAMYLGKPVIATAYSGNLDFTRSDNSFLVGWDPAAVPRRCGPYEPGSIWAEPRLAEAVQQMRLVSDSVGERELRASRGSACIRNEFSPEAVGRLMRSRLAIVNLKKGPQKSSGSYRWEEVPGSLQR